MIKQLDFSDETLAQRALMIQHRAYRIEANLIGFDGIPQLHETVADLRANDETFLGYFVDGDLAGMISYTIDDGTLDIGRLVVHPACFRRGIGRSLVAAVESIAGIQRWLVATGADNRPARTFYERLDYQLIEERRLPAGVTIAQYEKRN